MTRIPLLVIAGPTATGKTELALRLAERHGGEIVSADSMQIYRGLDVGTAKPTAADRARAPIHLIDFVDPRDRYTVADFQRDAREVIAEVHGRGNLPILCGGTGLYIRAVLRGFRFPVGDSAEQREVRQRLQEQAASEGPGGLYERLRQVDPVAAARIQPADLKRVIRALEVFELTGRPMSEQQTADGAIDGGACGAGACTPPDVGAAGGAVRARALHATADGGQHCVDESVALGYNAAYFVLTCPRERLYGRIEARVDAMLASGWLAEVARLRDEGYDPSLLSLQAIGYRRLMQHLAGERAWEDTVRFIKQETRRFAKRQETWFRRDSDAVWVSWADDVEFNAIEVTVSAAVTRLRG